MITHSIWAEKYRPQTLSEITLTEENRKKFESYIKNQDIPHLLFAGQTGSGKTTLAKIITRSIDCDYLMINASDENGIDTIRDKVKSFASSASFRPLKIVILDEADYLTSNAQHALRNVIETFAARTRFIFTCNHIEGIIDAILSRCTRVTLEPPLKIDVAKYISGILEAENKIYTNESIVEIINKKYPDTRATVNCIQENSLNGELKVPKIMSTGYQKDIVKLLSKPTKETLKEIRQLIVDNDVREFEGLYKTLYETYFDNPEILITLGEVQYKHALVPDKEINFIAGIAKIIEILNKKKQLLNG